MFFLILFYSFLLQILLAVEYFNKAENLDDADKNKNIVIALQKLKDCESLLHQHKQNDCKEPLFTATLEPFLVILFGCRAFIMVERGLTNDAKKEVFSEYLYKLHTK